MDFNNTQPIFIQIADYICTQALQGNFSPGCRIPSVRELAVQLEVNPNTVMRAYERLQNSGIIYNKRGIGYFIADNALTQIHQLKKQQFIDEILPSMFKEMQLLGIDITEIATQYAQFLSRQKDPAT